MLTGNQPTASYRGVVSDFNDAKERSVPAEKTEQVMVRMTPELLERLKEHANAEERSVAQTVRMAIRSYLGASDCPRW
jgi:predicted HicB family RNase H-like nuclease